MSNEVYAVEWNPSEYADCNAIFSTAKKALAYIEKELERMNLENIHIEPTVLGINDDWFSIDFRDRTYNNKGYVLCTRYKIDSEV